MQVGVPRDELRELRPEGGHAREHGHPVGLARMDDRAHVGLGARLHQVRAAPERAEEAVPEAERGVAARHRVAGVAGAEPQHVRRVALHRHAHVAVGVHGALRLSGRPRRVDDVGQVVGVHRGDGGGARLIQLLRMHHPPGPRGHRVVGDHDAHRGILEHRRQQLRIHRGVEGNRHAACRGDAEHRLHPVAPVPVHHGHVLPALLPRAAGIARRRRPPAAAGARSRRWGRAAGSPATSTCHHLAAVALRHARPLLLTAT